MPKTCSALWDTPFPGCTNPANAGHGLCQGHALQQKRGENLRPLQVRGGKGGTRPSRRTGDAGRCIALDSTNVPCQLQVDSHGFCKGHATQRDRGQVIRALTGKEGIRTRMEVGLFSPRRLGCEATVRDTEVTVLKIFPLDQENRETKGFCVCSPEHLPAIQHLRWGLRADGYLVARELGSTYNIRLHRFLYELKHGPIPPGVEVDHMNRDRGDNRDENLKLATKAEQRQNTNRRPAGEEHLRGTRYDPRSGRYETRVQVLSDTPEEAAKLAHVMRAALPESPEGRLVRSPEFVDLFMGYLDRTGDIVGSLSACLWLTMSHQEPDPPKEQKPSPDHLQGIEDGLRDERDNEDW